MERNYVLVLGAGLIALAVGLGALTPLLSTHLTAGGVDGLGGEVRDHINVILKVYKNGRLVREKVGDPVSDQWLALISKYLLGLGPYVSSGISWVTEDGNTRTQFGTEFDEGNPQPKLAIGTGSNALVTDHALANKVMEQVLDSNYITATDTGTEYNITYAYTFIVGQAYNISEAGLFIHDMYGTNDYSWVLIAHDTFSAVSLQANDGITIVYTFIINYSNPPFLKTFWQLLIDYFMGLRGAGCPVGTTQVDLGIDYDYYGGYYDKVAEKLYFAYAISNVSWSPTLPTQPTVTDKWVLRKVVTLVDSDQTIDAEAIAIQSNTQETYSVYGIMFYLYTDTNTDTGLSGGYVPIAYIYFGGQSSTVNWMDYYDVHLEIQFNRG